MGCRGVGGAALPELFVYVPYLLYFKEYNGVTPRHPRHRVRIGRKPGVSGGIGTGWWASGADPARLRDHVGCRADPAAGARRFAVAVDPAGRCAWRRRARVVPTSRAEAKALHDELLERLSAEPRLSYADQMRLVDFGMAEAARQARPLVDGQ